jgi:hypothetical protein
MKLKQFLMGLSPTPMFLPLLLMLTLTLWALTGCGATPVANPDFTPTPVTFNILVPYNCGQPSPVSMVIMRDVIWDFITLDDEDLVTTTIDGYKALGLNTSDWIAASFEMKEQRNFYRDCIMRSQKEIQDENMDAGLVPSIPTE